MVVPVHIGRKHRHGQSKPNRFLRPGSGMSPKGRMHEFPRAKSCQKYFGPPNGMASHKAESFARFLPPNT